MNNTNINMNNQTTSTYLAYRSPLIKKALEKAFVGECVALIGASGFGKSKIFRHLQNPVVLQYFFERVQTGKRTRTLFIFVDLQRMSSQVENQTDWNFYEVMIDSIISEIKNNEYFSDVVEEFVFLHERLMDTPNNLRGFRYLERIIKQISQIKGYGMIFIIDEFERVMNIESTTLLPNLRSIRDSFIYSLVFIIISRDHLSRFDQNPPEIIEGFNELFSNNYLGVGPYDPKSAQMMIEILLERINHTLSEVERISLTGDDCSLLFEVSGNHPGLMKALLLSNKSGLSTFDSPDALISYSLYQMSVVEECQKILDGISSEEQNALVDLTSGIVVDNINLLAILELKGIINRNNEPHKYQLFSPLMSEFMKRKKNTAEVPIKYNPQSKELWVHGKRATLSGLSFKLFDILATHPGRIHSKIDLIHYLYEDDERSINSGIPDNRIHNQIRHLREEIESDSANPKFIKTVHGRGYRLNPEYVEIVVKENT